MKICLWRLGSLEHKIFPTATAVEKFKNILSNLLLDEQSECHIVWGPDVDVQIIDINNLDEIDTESDLIKVLLSKNKIHVIEGLKNEKNNSDNVIDDFTGHC